MSFFAPLILPIAALVAALARWVLQGRGNVYTDLSSRYYVPDPDLGWRVVENGPVSLGLEGIGALLGYTVALGTALLLLRRWERRRGRPAPIPKLVRWGAAALPLVVPVLAFASGRFPDGAVERPPAGVVEAPSGSITGGLAGLPPGTYRAVAPHAGTSISADLSGGGDTFEARFASGIEGTWRGAPGDLRQPMSADVSVTAASVDTGIELRSKHAREEYLKADRFPTIEFHLDRLLGAAPAADGSVTYRADGTLSFMGRKHPVSVTGAIHPLDEQARRRQGLAAGDPVFRATAQFELTIKETALAADAGDFDRDRIPIKVSLLLRREAEKTQP